MATVEDYKSGLVVKQVKALVSLLTSTEAPSAGTSEGQKLQTLIAGLEPIKLNTDQAAEYINKAERCAVGPRACYGAFDGTPETKSVYLDELADGLVEVGKAGYVSKEQAIQTVKEQGGHPIVISKVSGKHMEICRTWPETCVYWNMEKRKLPCLDRGGK